MEVPNYYDYSPLDRYPVSIRLLRITAWGHNIFEYEIVHTTLGEAPPYECLSYVWGTNVRDGTIRLSDSTLLRVTKSLRKNLPLIAQHCETMYIWIDQVCIDQENLDERGQQVSIMGDIYRQCASVLVWIGKVRPLSFELRLILQEACRLPDETTPRSMQKNISWMLSYMRPDGENGGISHNRAFAEFKMMLRSEWFSRAWVFQEVVLPRQSRFIIRPQKDKDSETQDTAHLTMSLSSLYCVFAALSRHYVDNAREWEIPEHATTPRTLIDMYQGWSIRHLVSGGRPSVPIYQTLSMATPSAKTSNELDRLYAFFGLKSELERMPLMPNYGSDLETALIHTVFTIIVGTCMLDIFDTIPRGRAGASSTFTIPSWVPNYLSAQVVLPFRSSSSSFVPAFRHPFIRREIGDGMYPWLGTCDDDNRLHVHGRVIDIMDSQVVVSGRGYSLDAGHIDYLLRSAEKLQSKSDRRNERYTSERIVQALEAEGCCTPSFTSYLPLPEPSPEDLARDDDWSWQPIPGSDTRSVQRVMKGRELWTTQLGRLATGSYLAKGDLLCVLHGCSNPVALRVEQPGYFNPEALEAKSLGSLKSLWRNHNLLRKKIGTYRVLGTCYLEGWMDPWSNGKVFWKQEHADTFILV